MRYLLTNAILAMAWAALTGDVTLSNLIVGFVLGYGVLSLQQDPTGPSNYFRKGYQFVRLAAHFIHALVLSSFRVAHDVVTPQYFSRPGIVAVPLDAKSDFEIMLLANMVSLTPGSLSIDVSADRRTLYVHVMFVDDVESVRKDIKDNVERPLLELIR